MSVRESLLQTNLLVALSLGLVSCTASESWAAPPSAAQLPSCEEAWPKLSHENRAAELGKKLKPPYLYDFANDSGYAEFAQRFERKKCKKRWTVLVYMQADNDLTPEALWDLYEMEAGYAKSPAHAGSSLKTDVIVQLDTRFESGLRRIHVFQTEKKYETRERSAFENADETSVSSPVVGPVLDEKSQETEAERLQKFLLWAADAYPSEHYMVVVWGHGQGWAPKSTAVSEIRGWGGMAFDEQSGNFLDIPSLRSALAAFSKRIGHAVDVYAADACLMQMVEVAAEISDVTRFIVGSTQLQNFLGFPYRRIFYELNHGSFADVREQFKLPKGSASASDEPYLISLMMPKLYRSSLQPPVKDAEGNLLWDGGLQGRIDPSAIRYLTSSSLSSAELRARLMPSLYRLGQAFQAYLAERETRALDIRYVIERTPYFEGGAQDLNVFLGFVAGHLFEEKQSGGTLTPAAAILRAAVDAAADALRMTVMNSVLGTDYDPETNSDLQSLNFWPKAVSMWLPVTKEDFEARNPDFAQSRFFKGRLKSQEQAAWPAWLAELYRLE